MQESWSAPDRLAHASSHAWDAVTFAGYAVEGRTSTAWTFAHGDDSGGLHASGSAQRDAVNLLEEQLFPNVPKFDGSGNTVQEEPQLLQ